MLLGLVAFIVYLVYFVGIGSLFQLLSQLDLQKYSLFYSIAIAALVASVVFDSMIWHSLLEGLKVKLSLKKVVLYNWIGNFVEMVIPCQTVCGEVTRLYLAKKETKQNIGAAAAPIITSRILSTIVYTSGLLVGSLLLVITRENLPIFLVGTLLTVAVGSIGVISAVLILALKESAANKLVSVAMFFIKIITKSSIKQEEKKEQLRASLYSFTEAFHTYRKKPLLLVKPMVFAVLAWLSILIVYLMVFYSLDFTAITIVDLALVYCVVSTVETVTAGFPVGAVEITMISLYSVLGVPLVIAVAATTLIRLLTFWVQVIVGYPIFHLTGLKFLLRGGFTKAITEQKPN
jgi:glycosyltransferase 2 family protein